MSVIFLEGFDKYGIAGQPNAGTMMAAGEWTVAQSGSSPVAPLSSTGYAMQLAGTCFKTLSGNYTTLIFGVRFRLDVMSNGMACGLQDGGTTQCHVSIGFDGRLSFLTASTVGAVATQGVIHYLEGQITVGTAGAYQFWIDGVSVLSGTGNSKSTANSTANGIYLGGTSNVFDDLYLFDTSGPRNNAPLLNSPRVETTFAAGDAQTQFTNGAAIVGQYRTGGGYMIAFGNYLTLLGPYTAGSAMQVVNLNLACDGSSTTGKAKAVIYPDHLGLPAGQSLLATGTEVVGWTDGQLLTLPFASPPTLAAGTSYWLGFITDTNIVATRTIDPATIYVNAAVSYASGAPATCPTVGIASLPPAIWAQCTGSTVNWVSECQNGPPGDTSYIFSNIIGTEDLYTMNPLVSDPTAIYAVSAKCYARRSDNGARAIDVKIKSGGVDSAGTISNVTPGTNYSWVASYFESDPATGLPWTKTTLDAATTGPQIAS